MGGSGKTTLAKEVGKKLKQSEHFAHVIDTTVSFTPDTKKIQDDIAGPLGLKLEDYNDSDRPKKLWGRLTNGENILLIMDDVWDQGQPPLDFDLIGIPKRDNHKGCRLLITTRSKRIFNKLDCDKMIKLELLSEEEAWTMFKMYAGISYNSSNTLITKGRKIAKECKQLPVAIAIIASTLKGQHHRKHEWDVTLKSLKKHVAMDNVDDEKAGLYKCLKSSYDNMKDEKVKGLFLLSSIFPEDKEIPIEILTRLGIGTGLFREDNGRYDDARDDVVVAKNTLVDNCLLMEVGEKHVKMHDLVREVAQWIANKEIQSVNLSKKYQKPSLEMKMNIKYLFCKGKAIDLFSFKYDGSKLEILIFDMERDEDSKCIEVPNSFFENIFNLQVFYLIGHGKQTLSIPHSINSLTNIRSILVDGVDLGDISMLGNLQNLETLDLVKCEINELPHEIAKLGKFKVLNLEVCKIRRNDPFEVIKICPTLEELYFINSFNDFCGDITFPKLLRYHILTGRRMLSDSLSKYVAFDAGVDECFLSKDTLKFCMQTTEGLQLYRINEGWRNLIPEIVPIDQGMNDLVELHLGYNSELQCLIDTIGSQVSNALSKLVVLDLRKMQNLEELFNGSLPFDYLKNLEKLSINECEMLRRLFNCKLNLCNLKTITIAKCPLLVNLFPLLTSRNLVQLENLEITDCEVLTNIIIDERGEDESREGIDDSDEYYKSYVSMFPKLKVLVIKGCHLLESILPFLSSQDLPVLEVIRITNCGELKYIFGQYRHVEITSLKIICLEDLPKFIGIFQKYSHSMSSHVNELSSSSRDRFEVQTQVDAMKCNIFSWIYVCCHGNNYRNKLGSMSTTKSPSPSVHKDPLQNNSSASVSNSHLLQLWERAQCLRVTPYFMCNIKEITLCGSLNIESVFILSITPTMLVETLNVRFCHELKHIIVDTGYGVSSGNNWCNVFPKLRMLSVTNCSKLEYIFKNCTDDYQNYTKIHLHLQALQSLKLIFLTSLVAICPKQYCTTFPSLKKITISQCSHNGKKFIGVFNILLEESLDIAIKKELSGSIDHFITSERLPNNFCINEIEGEPTKLHDLHYMMCHFFVPKNPISLQGLKMIEIVRCEILEIVFSTSILRCLPQLISLRIEECKELKHIIKDDRQDQNLSPRTFFPKLEGLCVIKCHKLKSVFSVSVCKEFPELKVLWISEAHGLEEIFESERDQNVKISNLKMVVLINLPSLYHAQGIQLQTARNIYVENCQKLSLASAYSPSHLKEMWSFKIDFKIKGICSDRFREMSGDLMSDESERLRVMVKEVIARRKENKSEVHVLDLKAEAMNYTSKRTALTTAPRMTALANLELISASQESDLEKKQPMCQGLINQQDLLEKINTTVKPSQVRNGVEERIALTNAPTITTSTHLELASSSQEMDKVQSNSRQEEINTTVKPSQDVEDDTALTNSQTLRPSIHLELSTSSQVSDSKKEQPVSQQSLINQQVLLEKINTTVKPSQELEKEQATRQQGSINQQDLLGEIDITL